MLVFRPRAAPAVQTHHRFPHICRACGGNGFGQVNYIEPHRTFAARTYIITVIVSFLFHTGHNHTDLLEVHNARSGTHMRNTHAVLLIGRVFKTVRYAVTVAVHHAQ